MTAKSASRNLRIGAWLPADWRRPLTRDEKKLVEESAIDLLLIPENHGTWANRGPWKRMAEETDTAIYAGFEDGGWTLGLFYDPTSGRERIYTKHSTSENIAPDRDDWTPEDYLHTPELNEIPLGTTICHDHYLSPFMRYESENGAAALLNLSASPVVRRKWGELLQARAIENGAYVVCMMHGRESDGSESRTNKGHVFAFDPYGDQIELTELGTDRDLKPFETEPDNVYSFDLSSTPVLDARRSLTDRSRERSIDRVRQNRFESAKPTETTLDARVEEGQIELVYSGERATVDVGESSTLPIGGETFSLVSLEGEEAFQPELLYQRLLGEAAIEDHRILIHNQWDRLSVTYLENVVEPVLRARCVEWCSPILLTADDNTRAYQLANKHKDTHEIPRDSDGRFNFETKRAFGVESTLKPVDGKSKPLREVALECSSDRLDRTSI